MHITPEEYSRVQQDVLSVLRRKRFFTLPKVRAYPVTVKVLEDLEKEGLVSFSPNNFSSRYYAATNLLPHAGLVREVRADDVRVGFLIGNGATFLVQHNKKWAEFDMATFEKVGFVEQVRRVMVAKNFLEVITFRKSREMIEITTGDKTTLFDKAFTFQVVRSEY